MDDERVQKIQDSISTAKGILSQEGVRDFASTLPNDKKFHAALQGYSNNVARTTGTRSVDDLVSHVYKHVAKRKVSDRLKQKELESHLDMIGSNRDHFESIFTAHNNLTNAKHEMTGHLRDHHDLFDIRPHREEEHEGIVANSNSTGTTAKFVPEGPEGFAAKNKARTAELQKGR